MNLNHDKLRNAIQRLVEHDSHGIGMIPHYVRNLENGTLVPNTAAHCERDEGAILSFDGQRGYGQRVAAEAMQAAIERCLDTGVVLMTLRNAHHVGRIGTYGNMAADAGLVSLHFVNVCDHSTLVAPWGGSDGRFVTNPVCLAMPAGNDCPATVLDMATSQVAVGKVRVAMNEGRKMDDGMLLDADGQPSNDPAVMLRRGGIVNNMFNIVVNPARLVDQSWLKSEIDSLIGYFKESPPRDPAKPVLIAGDPERLSRETRLQTGIPVDSVTWAEITEAGEKLGYSQASLNDDAGV